MDLCNESRSSGWLSSWLAVFYGKNFNTGRYMQTVQPNFLIPAMLVGSVDFYHFIPLSVTMTSAGGHKVSTKQDLLASFCGTFFQLISMKPGK